MPRFINRVAMLEKVNYCNTYVWELEKLGLFPKRIKLSERRVVWDEDEIDQWLIARKTNPITTEMKRSAKEKIETAQLAA